MKIYRFEGFPAYRLRRQAGVKEGKGGCTEMNNTPETDREKAANVPEIPAGLTQGQRAAANLGMCAHWLESLDTRQCKEIGAELRALLFKVEHLAGRREVTEPFHSAAATPHHKALAYLQECRSILLKLGTGPAKHLEQYLAPYADEIAAIKTDKARIM